MASDRSGRGRHGGRAVVIGGSLAGLAAAGALGRHFDRVTIVERDRFPDELHDVLLEWFSHIQNPRSQVINTTSLPDFLVDLSTPIYRQLTTDAMELLSYLKRFTKVAAA
ncbi:MAG: type III-B CRISPR module-associated protein Cmr5 [Pseudonocardiaceae bacterium]